MPSTLDVVTTPFFLETTMALTATSFVPDKTLALLQRTGQESTEGYGSDTYLVLCPGSALTVLITFLWLLVFIPKYR